MEVTTQEFKHCDLIKVKGRVDSSTAPDFSKALEKANQSGRFKIAIDMSELEYMSSAGFRALLASQRNCKRYNRGELVLVCCAGAHPRSAGTGRFYRTLQDL